MAEYQIRPAHKDDCRSAAYLLGLLNKAEGMADYYWPDEEQLRDNVDAYDLLIANAGGRDVGLVAGFRHFNPNNAFFRYVVTSLYVEEKHRKQGIGEALLKSLILNKKGDNIRQFAIDVMPENTQACSLYEKLGFEQKETGFLSYRLGFDKLDSFYNQASVNETG